MSKDQDSSLEAKYNALKNNFSEALNRIFALETILSQYEAETKIESFDLLKENTSVLNHNSSIYSGESRLGGRGVFAQNKIVKGTAIELAPFIICFRQSLNNTPLLDYYFIIEDEGQLLCAVPMGFGMLYNHSDEPMAHWILDIERREILFLAVRDIEAGEEITINYGSEYWNSPERKAHKK